MTNKIRYVYLRRHIIRKFTCVTVFYSLLSWLYTGTVLPFCVCLSYHTCIHRLQGIGVEVQKHGDPLSALGRLH